MIVEKIGQFRNHYGRSNVSRGNMKMSKTEEDLNKRKKSKNLDIENKPMQMEILIWI